MHARGRRRRSWGIDPLVGTMLGLGVLGIAVCAWTESCCRRRIEALDSARGRATAAVTHLTAASASLGAYEGGPVPLLASARGRVNQAGEQLAHVERDLHRLRQALGVPRAELAERRLTQALSGLRRLRGAMRAAPAVGAEAQKGPALAESLRASRTEAQTLQASLERELQHALAQQRWAFWGALGAWVLSLGAVGVAGARLAWRRGAAEQLRSRTETDLGAALHAIAEAVVFADGDGRILRMNPSAEGFTGRRFAEVKDWPIQDVVRLRKEPAGPAIPVPVEEVVRGRRAWGPHPAVLAGLDGRDRPVAVTVAPVPGLAQERCAQAVLTLQDVRPEHQARERVRQVTAVLRAIRNVEQAMVLERDRDRLLERVCQRLVKTRGYAAAWAVLVEDETVCAAEGTMAAGGRPAILRDLRGGELPRWLRSALGTSRVRTVTSSEISCEEAGPPSEDRALQHMIVRLECDGTVYGAMGVALPERLADDPQEQHLFAELAGDVAFAVRALAEQASRDAAEQQLRESEEKYRCVVEHAKDAILVVQQGKIRYANPRFADLAGMSPRQAIGSPLERFFSDEQGRALMEALHRRLHTRGEAPISEATLVRADGGEVEVELHAGTIPYEGEEADLLFVRDVRARRQMEAQLRQSQKLDAIGRLAGGVAHDFNNQLGGILGYAELLKIRLQDDEKLRQYVDAIITACRRGADLTAQLLTFARRGRQRREPVSIHEVIGEVCTLLERSIDRRIRIRRDLRAVPDVVQGDPTLLQNAILNLALNARDAMPEGGDLCFSTDVVLLDAEYWRRRGQDLAPGAYLQVQVTDTGQGMDVRTRARAFEPFFTTKKEGQGTGMGLAAVYGTAKAHGGTVEMDSAPHQGTTARMHLPLAEQATAEAAQASPETVEGSGRLLVADDEPDMREMLRVMLQGLGYEVAVAADGDEAARMYLEEPGRYDLMVLDMDMPRVSGAEAMRRIRASDAQARVLLVSGYSMEGPHGEAPHVGEAAFVQKPFSRALLSQAVAEALRGAVQPK